MAEANEIEYARNLDVVRLRGNARIVEGGRRSLAGEYFEYDLKTDKVSRGGPVRISILPAKSKPDDAEAGAPAKPEQQPSKSPCRIQAFGALSTLPPTESG